MKFFILFIISLACVFPEKVASGVTDLPYNAIFNFGDSISDTGNAASFFPAMPSNSPYGSTYFKHPSGRMSNGRLIIDFIAEAYGLPMLPPYLTLNVKDGLPFFSFTAKYDAIKGVNFAFAGATALSQDYFVQKMLNAPHASTFSLSTQLNWFKRLKSSLCTNKEECINFFGKSLFMVGEIGGNDINALIPYKNITLLQQMVPLIMEAITNTTTALIEEGAIELVIPGNFPIGCNSAVLATINSVNKDDYDEFGCLKSYNDFIKYYNEQLRSNIESLRTKHKQVRIIYFDYYGATKRLYQAPQEYGFSPEKNEIFRACCGKGEPYNLDKSIFCGMPVATVCPDPSKRINWDGAHFTEEAYKQIAKGLIEDQFAQPSLKSPLFKIA